MPKNKSKIEAWDKSYDNHQNFLYYPNENVIRFVSKYICKRTDINKVSFIDKIEKPIKILDVGCGIGRHMLYFDTMQLDAYGFDISESALRHAKNFFKSEQKEYLSKRLRNCSSINLPFKDSDFSYMVAHGVLDSMSFDNALKSIAELARCIKKNGLFYVDLISGDESAFYREFCGEITVKRLHEKNTMQSYFNWSKINKLIGTLFVPVEAVLVTSESLVSKHKKGRYYLVLKKL